ncbi:MAG: hypothetical protein K2W92_08520 [Alphaproteobacteria bacterium]|nr:hypothetical protein [Alphaproteobacteria bacterium]
MIKIREDKKIAFSTFRKPSSFSLQKKLKKKAVAPQNIKRLVFSYEIKGTLCIYELITIIHKINDRMYKETSGILGKIICFVLNKKKNKIKLTHNSKDIHLIVV